MADQPRDAVIECPKCLYSQTVAELRQTHRCGKCGHSTRSGAQLREMRHREEVAELRSRLHALEAENADLKRERKSTRRTAAEYEEDRMFKRLG